MTLRIYTPPAAAAPSCPRCGAEMTGGAPHGPWPNQWECRHCGYVLVPTGGAAPVGVQLGRLSSNVDSPSPSPLSPDAEGGAR